MSKVETSSRQVSQGTPTLEHVTNSATAVAGSPAHVPALPESAVEHGEVFTRPWVVDLILDLVAYTPDRDLADLHAVEPACGHGAFLGPMVARLSASLRARKRSLSDAAEAIQAFDLLPSNVDAARRLVVDVLAADGWDRDEASALADKWVQQGDYLLRGREDGTADLVVGNPPYIRLEEVPEERSAANRKACVTMGGRADIYVGFIEVGLRALRPGGLLGFIVADRWMRNSYGKRLREFVAENYSVDVTIQMHDVGAFEEQVSAYPAVSVIRRGAQDTSNVADRTCRFGEAESRALVKWTRQPRVRGVQNDAYEVDRLPHWFAGGDLWPAGSPVALSMIEHLNERFQPLEDLVTRTGVGIGIATGADAVYVTKDSGCVEPERLLPLSMAANTNSGELVWSGNYLVNPWGEDGKPEGLPAGQGVDRSVLSAADQATVHQDPAPLDQRQGRAVQLHPADRMGLRHNLDE